MANLPAPHVVHLGKKSRKQIKKYKKGFGAMHYEVQHIVSQAKEQLGTEKEVLPVVVVHRRKKKKKRRGSWGWGSKGWSW